MSANRFMPAAQNVAQAILRILSEQGLDPLISRYVLTENEQGNAWFFVVMDESVTGNLESFASPDLISKLSAGLQGHPVLFSNSFGPHYSILLSPSIIG